MVNLSPMEMAKDDVDWCKDYITRMAKPLGVTYRKYKHLGQVLREGMSSPDPVRRAATEMWVAIEEANAKSEALT